MNIFPILPTSEHLNRYDKSSHFVSTQIKYKCGNNAVNASFLTFFDKLIVKKTELNLLFQSYLISFGPVFTGPKLITVKLW